MSLAVPSLASADTLGYPDWNMPCEHSPYNTTGTCANYDWGPKHTQTYNDPSEYSSRGYAYRNCTDYVAWKLQSLGIPDLKTRGRGNGKGWDDSSAGVTITHTPEVGDAAVWNSSTFGHVAYVEEIRPRSGGGWDARVSEYNYAGTGEGSNTRWVQADNYVDFNGVGSPLSSGAATDAFMVRTSAGAAFGNNMLGAGMTRLTNDGDAQKIAVGGNYMGLINGCGALYGRNSLSAPGWTQMTACGDARAVAVGSAGIYVIINGCGAAYSNSNISMSGWTPLTGCGDAIAVSAGGKNVALINSGGTAYAAINWWGPLQQVSNPGDAQAIAISSGGMLMMINGCGGAFTNNSFSMGGWSQKASCGDALRVATGGHRFVLVNSNGTAYATDTWNGGMTQVSNPGDAHDVSVGDTGTMLMISGCGSAVANNNISVNGWSALTGCGDALAIAG
jgi:surface antigen